jgi:hypothetical protein
MFVVCRTTSMRANSKAVPASIIAGGIFYAAYKIYGAAGIFSVSAIVFLAILLLNGVGKFFRK